MLSTKQIITNVILPRKFQRILQVEFVVINWCHCSPKRKNGWKFKGISMDGWSSCSSLVHWSCDRKSSCTRQQEISLCCYFGSWFTTLTIYNIKLIIVHIVRVYIQLLLQLQSECIRRIRCQNSCTTGIKRCLSRMHDRVIITAYHDSPATQLYTVTVGES